MDDKTALNETLAEKKKFSIDKKWIMFAMFFAVCISCTFASDGIATLDTWAEKILSLFTSTWVKALLCVVLIIEAIAMVCAGQQGGGGQMIKRFAPWIIGTLILLSATGITSFFTDGMDFSGLSS